MWKLYLKSDEGVAIQSTFPRLKQSIIDGEKVFIGQVKYLDYNSDLIDNPSNYLEAFVHKRKSFEHEKEIRAVVFKGPWTPNGEQFDFKIETIQHGLHIKVDIECLIEKIFIAPGAPKWLADLVKAVVKQYGYSFEVVQSDLSSSPMF